MTFGMPLPRRAWPFVVVATVATLALYWPSLSFDLFADDYLFLRPWTAAEWQAAWTGPWLTFPTAPPFYRPLTTTMYTGMFALFGMNAAALHWLTLPVMIGAATMVGLYTAHALKDDRIGWLSTLLFVVFPGAVTSIGPWIVNQYHGLLVITCAAAWRLWPTTPHISWSRWAGLATLAAAAAWLKEDGVMLPLALVAGHAASAWWSGTTPPPPRRLVLAAGAITGVLFLWRLLMLGTFGGYAWWPEPRDMALNLVRGIAWTTLVQRGSLPAAALATVCTAALCLAGTWRAWRSPSAPESRLFVFAGAAFCVFLLPHTLMSSMTRSHLLSLAAVTLLTAALTPLLRRGVLVRAGLALGLVALAVVSRERLSAFAPCAEEARYELGWVIPEVRAWGPPEMATWLEGLSTCEPGTKRRLVTEVDTLTWGLTAPSVNLVLFVHEGVSSMRWTVSADSPQTVTLFVDGYAPQTVDVGPTPRVFDLTFSPTWRTSLRAMHRVDLVSTRPLRWTSQVDTLRRSATD